MDTDELELALADPALSPLITELQAAGHRPPPPIGAVLADILADADHVRSLVRAPGRRRVARRTVAGLLTVGVMAGGLGAAAANELPRPAQTVVSNVVNKLTPFDLPNPDEHGTVEHQQDSNVDDEGNQPGQDTQSPGDNHHSSGTQGDRSDEPGTNNNGQSGEPSADRNDTNANGQRGSNDAQRNHEGDQGAQREHNGAASQSGGCAGQCQSNGTSGSSGDNDSGQGGSTQNENN